MAIDQTKQIIWETYATPLSDRQLNLLVEIFNPTPVHGSYTMNADGFAQGKTRTFIANTDHLINVIFDYVNALSRTQGERLVELVEEYEEVMTKTMPLLEAERVEFRPGEPEEKRLLIKKRIQTYVPIFTDEERNEYLMGMSNWRLRG